ncbi:MAG: hypothetical protein RLZZ511_2551 [Cyanobacteriota bacterium]
MVREAKPLTSIMPVPTPKKGRLVLEVQDPAAIADLGEQLSLANQLLDLADLSDTPADGVAVAAPKSTRSKATSRKSTRQAPAASRAKAKQQNRRESSVSVPLVDAGAADRDVVDRDVVDGMDGATAAQMRDRMAQMGAMIEQMQQRLSDLQAAAEVSPQASNPPAISPTLSSPGRSRSTRTRHLRLPDWQEPELRSHYTLQESARAYEALEALHQHRKLQTAEMTELVQAKAIAAQLRPPAELPSVERPSVELSGMRSPLRGLGKPMERSTVRRSRRTRSDRSAFRLALNGRQLLNWAMARLPVPADPSAKIVDLALWVAGAIVLRLLVKSMIYLFPALVVPLNLLMALPAIVAAYLAFCVPNGRSDVIYRLLLLTLGLFLGSRF